MENSAHNSIELQIIVPVFNEECSIQVVLTEWCCCLDATAINYVITFIDDGSGDRTAEVLQSLGKKNNWPIEVLTQTNCGHGQAILRGYRYAIKRGVPWIFQIDSDGQCDPMYFPRFWQEKDGGDIVAGRRTRRDDGLIRAFVSFTLRYFVLFLFRTHCEDANVPYRLMRTSSVAPLIEKIPSDCSFTNVALSVLARRYRLKQRFIPITFRNRIGGTSTVSYRKLIKHAFELYLNIKALQSNNTQSGLDTNDNL
jgi:dolichol-phosphate mannosyltransferase